MSPAAAAPPPPPPPPQPRQHGVKGVYYGGEWLDLEDCDGAFTNLRGCSGCPEAAGPCPRSRSRNAAAKSRSESGSCCYDVVVVGAGCVGGCVARELSRHRLSVLWVDAADDVSQGATKGNSGIVHAGYDDTPGSVRSRYCWRGNQMYPQLDRELRFGYQKNGSLVVAFSDPEVEELKRLMDRGRQNGVEGLRIVGRDELLKMEPHVNPEAVAALHAPEAGQVIPYEFAVALAESAVDNGVELRLRREVVSIQRHEEPASNSAVPNGSSPNQDGGDYRFTVVMDHWEPGDYLRSVQERTGATGRLGSSSAAAALAALALAVAAHYVLVTFDAAPSWTTAALPDGNGALHAAAILFLLAVAKLGGHLPSSSPSCAVSKATPLKELVAEAGPPAGGKAAPSGGGAQNHPVSVPEMLVGGSGSSGAAGGSVVEREAVRCRFVVNCAGGGADRVARMVGDDSFKIKPRIGDYILLNRNQGHLARHTLFPCPDPVLGKGVLVQTTLWGNLILGPTARDVHKPDARDMTPASVQEYILGKCKRLVPAFDAREAFHAFAGARAKSDRNDWIVGPSPKDPRLIHVAGIDSPGLAGAPAIALDVVRMLEEAGLEMVPDPGFNPNRAPIITPKDGMRGLKMGPAGKFDSDGIDEAKMASNVVCKCERVTELEVVRAMRRSLPIDSSQGIRKRTRAGMGHCQGDPDNYGCEARVRAIVARENGVPVGQVGARPWPATSTLPQRWIDDGEKRVLQERMDRSS